MQVLYLASVSEEVAADSILDTASVAIRTIKQASDYAKDRGLKVFRVTIEEVRPVRLSEILGKVGDNFI